MTLEEMTLETAFRLEITTPLLSHMTEEERKATHIRWERLQRIIELAQLGQPPWHLRCAHRGAADEL